MSDVRFNIIGFPPANAGLTAMLKNTATGETVASLPVLPDGTVNARNIPAGSYHVVLEHANLLGVNVAVQTIHVMAQGETKVVMMIDPKKFTNTAIADVADVNLTPLIDESASIQARAAGLGNKQGGELFTAADYNSLAGAVRDLAGIVGSLLHGVTPVGHNHLEYENKLNELSTNFQELLQTLTTATLQMQRRFEIQKVRSRVEDVLNVSSTDTDAVRKTVLEILTAMEGNVTLSPVLYAQKMRAAATAIKAALSAIVTALGTTAPQIVANYNAVMAEWATKSGKNIFSEVTEATLPPPTTLLFETSGFADAPFLPGNTSA
jgi:hypothetical protein